MWFNNMEKIIISILITVTIWGVNTQFTELTVLGPNLYEPNAFSVTTAKVWKITSISGSNGTVTNQGAGSVVAHIFQKMEMIILVDMVLTLTMKKKLLYVFQTL